MNEMTLQEARMIAALRMHFKCSFSKLAGICRAVWGGDRCKEMSGGRYDYGSPLGQSLVVRMEEVLGLEHGESDRMTMDEHGCMACGWTEWSLTYPADVGKECGRCGKMTTCFKTGGDKQ